MSPDPLEVELLVPLSKRRTLTVAAHQEFREWLHGPAQTRPESEVSRVHQLLDEIEEDGEGRFA